MLRIDAHSHIFTLRSILSREAIRVITQRLLDAGAPAVLARAVEDLLSDQLKKPRVFDERRLLKALLEKLLRFGEIQKAIPTHFAIGPLSVNLEHRLDDLAVEALSDAITKLVDSAAGGGKVGKIFNVLQTLRQAMQPTITDIADDILAPMMTGNPGDECVIVALMMDIFGADESGIDRATYLSQISGTAEAALQRPGRVLPFFGIHPDRPGHLQELKAAVSSKGFIGVKLYPSLDYKVDSERMRDVYRYCVEAELPVLLHCGHGGFYRTKAAINQCDPAQWEAVLADSAFEKLRVCFAHFGGWEALGHRACLDPLNPPALDNWSRKIYLYMKRYPNVYTDLAKHVEMFENAAHGQTYFDTLRELISDSAIGHRILYGTDAWLLRLDMPFHDYLAKWKAGAGTAYDSISVTGPRAFLGFADRQEDWAGNLKRFVELMRDNRARLGDDPAPWLATAIGAPCAKDRDHPGWNFRRMAVRDTYQFLGKYLTKAQKGRGHRQNRLLTLKELAYYDPADPNFVGVCRHLARIFIDFADTNIGYAPGHSFSSTVELFVEIFHKGDLTLSEVAMTLDTVLNYPEKIS